jgi:DNA-binding GntR family transcriptional regulator
MPEAVMSSVSVPSRTEAVLDALKHAILTGRLSPGQPLVETELAAQLGVSKTPVREALKTLSGAGLVTMSPYKGASVRTVDDALAHSVYDIRILLEPEAVRRSANRGEAGRASWDAARAALDAADRATDRADRQQANREFHRALYAGCGNDLMVGILDGLRDQTALVSTAVWTRNATWEQEAAEHRTILEAVGAGRADDAATLLEEHIRAFVDRNFGAAKQ